MPLVDSLQNCKGEIPGTLHPPGFRTKMMDQIYPVIFFKGKKWLLVCHLGRDGALLAVKGLLVQERLPLPSSQLVAGVLREDHVARETLELSDVVDRRGSEASANFDPKRAGVSRCRELQVAEGTGGQGCPGTLRIIPPSASWKRGGLDPPQLPFPNRCRAGGGTTGLCGL